MQGKINQYTHDVKHVIKEEDFEIYQIKVQYPQSYTYLIKSGDEAAIVHPIQDLIHHLDYFQEQNLKIKYVFETQNHTDTDEFLEDIQKQLECEFIYGDLRRGHPFKTKTQNKDQFSLGKIQMEVHHTPGVSLDSTIILLKCQDKPIYLFPGETLILDDVGNIDFSEANDQNEKEQQCESFYKSIKNIMKLPDDLIILPSQLSEKRRQDFKEDKLITDTLLKQKERNSILHLDRITFKETVQQEYVQQDRQDSRKNSQKIVKHQITILNQSKHILKTDPGKSTVLDFRKNLNGFFIKDALYFGPRIQIKNLLNHFISKHKQLQMICDEGKQDRYNIELSFAGFDNISGYLDDLELVPEEEKIPFKTIPLEEFTKLENIVVIDVRTASEFEDSRIKNSWNVPAMDIMNHLKEVDKQETYYVISNSGQRSLFVASILLNYGVKNVFPVDQGIITLTLQKYENLEIGPQKQKSSQAKCVCEIF